MLPRFSRRTGSLACPCSGRGAGGPPAVWQAGEPPAPWESGQARLPVPRKAGCPMRLFLSAGEPSGDMHGANLIRRLRERHPGLDVIGFGGEKMAAAGARLVYPLCDFAVMGLGAAILAIPKLKGILNQAKEAFARERPDAV